MGYVRRDNFASNVGDYLLDDGESDLGMDLLQAPRRRRKTKTRRAVAHRTRRRKKVSGIFRRSRRRRSRSPRRSKSRRRGMSKEFLRQLRKKHHLGEFKNR